MTVMQSSKSICSFEVAQDGSIAKVYFDSYSTKVIRTRAFNHEGPRRLTISVYLGMLIKFQVNKKWSTRSNN